jgi:hypothetical protein
MKLIIAFLVAIPVFAGNVKSLGCHFQDYPINNSRNASATLEVNQPSLLGKLVGRKQITSVQWNVATLTAKTAPVKMGLDPGSKTVFSLSYGTGARNLPITSVKINTTTYPIFCGTFDQTGK